MTKTKPTLPIQFPFFATYSNALSQIPDEQREKRAELALSIIEYGAWGIEPDFGTDWMLSSIFEAIRINLDNSVRSSVNGKKGGRPKKSSSEDVDPTRVKKLAKAMKTVYEYEPIPEELLAADADYMLDRYEQEREALRQEVESEAWIG